MKRSLLVIAVLLCNIVSVYAANNMASTQLQFTIPPFLNITPISSPTLVANVSDRTGNLYAPLYAKFKVISNVGEGRTLYLGATTTTEAGEESAMFSLGGQVYIAFSNILNPPTSNALLNCKEGSHPKYNLRVVAYPVTSVIGEKAKFNGNKYEVVVKNGVTYITINIGTSVLRTSFSDNDPIGVYKATITLTEIDN